MDETIHYKAAEMAFNPFGGPPGDVIWLPENTPLRHEGDRAMMFHPLHPVDWHQQAGL